MEFTNSKRNEGEVLGVLRVEASLENCVFKVYATIMDKKILRCV